MSTNKTIDGLPVRKANSSRAVPLKPSAHSTASAFAVPKMSKNLTAPVAKKPIIKPTTKPVKPAQQKPLPVKKPKITEQEAHEDFLRPVESFDFDFAETDLKKEQKTRKKAEKRMEGKKKEKPGKARKIITTILLLIVLAIIGVVAWALIWGNDIITKLTGGSSNIWDAISVFTNDNYIDLKTAPDGRTNILIFGTSGYDMAGTAGDYEYDGSQLTDSIMALSFDQYSGDVAMVSLPRDLKVPQACYAGKINEVYTCGNMDGNNEIGGANNLIEAAQDVLGLEFQYYAHINWNSLIYVVDSLGGITVTLDEDIDDYGWTNAKFTAGVPTAINGEQALGLARARHGTEGGDFTRGTSQQKILIGIKDKLVEKLNAGNFSLTDAIGLVSSLGDNLRSNISIEEVKTGMHLAQSLDFNQMRQVYLIDYINYTNSYMTTATINGISYVVPVAGAGNYYAIHDLIAREFNANPIIREAATIAVLNGTETDGLAGTEANNLKADGYNVTIIDNAPEGNEYKSAFSIYLMNPEKTQTARTLKGTYNAEIQPAENLPAGIDATGIDIVLILGSVL